MHPVPPDRSRATEAHGPCDDVRRLSVFVGWLLRHRDVRLSLTARGRVDLSTLDALARLALTARRTGRALVVHSDDPGLCCLARLTGLADAIPLTAPPRTGGSDAGRQPEALEDRLAEEVVDVGDPTG